MFTLVKEDSTYPKVKSASTQGKVLYNTKLTEAKLNPQAKEDFTYPKRLSDLETLALGFEWGK